MMTPFKNLKIVLIALVIAFTAGACGSGGGAATTETVVGLSTADNAQLLND